MDHSEPEHVGRPTRVPAFATMRRIPGGLMLIPLALGVLANTFTPGAMEIGGFTTALFSEGALTLIALLIVATGAQITGSRSGKAAAGTTMVVLVAKTLVPITLAVLLGLFVGIQGIWGISILALLVIYGNSNGALWLAFAGQYGDERDSGAYVASAFDDGPFLALIFLGASGLGEIPLIALVAAIVPFVFGLVIGALDAEWTAVLTAVPAIVIPFMSFAVGTNIDLRTVITGGLQGAILGVGVVALTGGLTYLGYKYVLRRGPQSGIGFAAGTTAGNAVAVPAVVAVADPRFEPYVAAAASQAAAAVLVTALLAPAVAAWVLRRQGGIRPEAVSPTLDTPAGPAPATRGEAA